MRKLKTIQKILEEFPEAKFDPEGGIHYTNDCYILPSNLHLFGGTHDVKQWDERLLEPEIKKPKLLAYENVYGHVTWFNQASRSDQFIIQGDRRPEYDIEANQ